MAASCVVITGADLEHWILDQVALAQAPETRDRSLFNRYVSYQDVIGRTLRLNSGDKILSLGLIDDTLYFRISPKNNPRDQYVGKKHGQPVESPEHLHQLLTGTQPLLLEQHPFLFLALRDYIATLYSDPQQATNCYLQYIKWHLPETTSIHKWSNFIRTLVMMFYQPTSTNILTRWLWIKDRATSVSLDDRQYFDAQQLRHIQEIVRIALTNIPHQQLRPALAISQV